MAAQTPISGGEATRVNGSNHGNKSNQDDNGHAQENANDFDSSSESPYYYLTAEAAAAIPKFQYRGEDRSLLYKYVLSPLAQYLVDHWTPSTLAPNSITLLGLVLMGAAYGFVWYHVPTLEVENQDFEGIPRWIFLYNCVAMLVYQTLDNMDGKQARKTKSSSPLGLLFDHGCDAVNSIFGSANWIVAMGLNPWNHSLLCWFLVVGPYALFYIATWEEYYTGELILPIFNGPNEGLVGGAMLSLTTYFYGPQFWQGYSAFDQVILPILSLVVAPEMAQSLRIQNCTLQGLVTFVGISQEVILKSLHVSRKYGIHSLRDSAPFFAVSFATLLIGWCDKGIWIELPRTSLHLYACLSVEMVTELMRAHIAHQKFEPFRRWINYPLFLFAAVVVICTALGYEKPSWTKDYITIYTTAACTYLAMKLAIVIDEICRVLNIWCFDIVTPRTRIRSSPTHAKGD